ncbi:copper fist DNA-binding domain-containing protein [Aspergillus clavatus NRRL 1]|uniref:Copper fist DNA binding domain protein n=1 Tax=Aspergillus clavatus (strain ATCC 1007 / CBS 513.65 / DSM 816 / NCTC 3887 / NRRL 1 / QM 1276 / 107) TaxID=344612 RepID=A1C5L2_ASPCL|nr:Copper fist DNA binding domain protein [Aspergillus clavatus NRRL 1]EAW14980.1 Copper fist DNA binding domain protein [Aspergillus clavatus NRRL 1]
MLVNGEKWACGYCVRGHRVSTCQHHDRPLTRINRKGRPSATCAVCNNTPCPRPREHSKLKSNTNNTGTKSSPKVSVAMAHHQIAAMISPLGT